MADIFDLQDEITESVVAAIEPHLYAQEGLRAVSQSPEKISTWGLVVRAIGLINKVGRQENEDARHLLNRAVALEPLYAKAHAILSWAVYWQRLTTGLLMNEKVKKMLGDMPRMLLLSIQVNLGLAWFLGFA